MQPEVHINSTDIPFKYVKMQLIRPFGSLLLVILWEKYILTAENSALNMYF